MTSSIFTCFYFCGMSDCQKTMFCMDDKTISGKYPLHLKRSLGKGWKSETSLWHEVLHLFTKLSCSYQFVPFESLKVLSHQVHCPTAIQQESNSHAMNILLVEHVQTSKHHEKPAVSKIGHSWHTWVFPKLEVPQNRWFIMENPIKMDDLGGTTIFGNIHIQSYKNISAIPPGT